MMEPVYGPSFDIVITMFALALMCLAVVLAFRRR